MGKLTVNKVSWTLIALMWTYNIGLFLYRREMNKRYPPADKLPVLAGMVHHPTYGVYPQEVVFTQGMDLKPGQVATAYVAGIEKEKTQ